MRAKPILMIASAGVLLILATVSARAHHAFAAEFDAKQPVKFKAVVTRMEWTNPHVWIHVDVKQPDGCRTTDVHKPLHPVESFG